MRVLPAFQVSITRFGIWRSAVLALATLVVASTLAWTLAQPVGARSWIHVGPGLAAAVWLCAWLVKSRPIHLRWDGQCWHLDSAAGHEPWPGSLSVAMDLGFWMLLRFRSEAPFRRVTWLPVQRRGLEAHWHALRCAVYSARPASGPNAATGPHSPA
jgi:hypothetical protein